MTLFDAMVDLNAVLCICRGLACLQHAPPPLAVAALVAAVARTPPSRVEAQDLSNTLWAMVRVSQCHTVLLKLSFCVSQVGLYCCVSLDGLVTGCEVLGDGWSRYRVYCNTTVPEISNLKLTLIH